MSLLIKSVVPVWLLAVAGTVAVGAVASTADDLVLLPVVLAAAALLTFCVQLGIRRPEGFVNRVTASITGVVVVLAIGTLVLGLVPFALAP